MKRYAVRFATTLVGVAAAAGGLAGTSGATHLGSLQLGHANISTAQTSLTGNLGSPVLKVVNQGAAAALRGEAQSGIGVNGVSTSGTGQQGQSQSGIGLVGTHGATTGINPGIQGQTASTDPSAAAVIGKNMGGGAGLRAIVDADAPPLAVNSSVKVENLNVDRLDNRDSTDFWQTNGNAGTLPVFNFIGTIDDQPLIFKVNGQQALRIEPNAISPNLIGGSSGNSVDAGQFGSVIAGGGTADPGGGNHVENSYDFIGAGYGNQAGEPGGSGASAVVAGTNNVASGGWTFIGAGRDNTASGLRSTVGGGDTNTASGFSSTVAGGYQNTASGAGSTVAGNTNTASGPSSTVAGGIDNTASGSVSTVAGGSSNTASGDFSFAAGSLAQATEDGSFVWGDFTATDLTSPAANTFTVRASGGIWLGTTSSPSVTAGHFIDTSTGGYLSSAGAWTNASDRTLKHDFRPVDKRSVLERVARMPIPSWSYKAEKPSVRHLGPMAQDFYAAFGLGLDDKHITTIDEGGVALAAIQGLYRENKALKTRLIRLERTVAGLRDQGTERGRKR
jgi:hypothetical protein